MSDTSNDPASRHTDALPYDPVEWEQRLAAARARRAKALDGKSPKGDADRSAARAARGAGAPPSAAASAGDVRRRPRPASWPERRAWQLAVVAALVVGALAGASVRTFMATGAVPADVEVARAVPGAAVEAPVPDMARPPAVTEERPHARKPAVAPPAGTAAEAMPQEEPGIPPAFEASRVLVYVPPSVPAAQRGEIVDALEQARWHAEAPRTTRFTISETHVRYYHETDREAALALADALDAEARDFTSFAPSPEPGLLELWLAGRGPPRRDVAVARLRFTPPEIPDLRLFLDRLASSLPD